MKVGVGDPAPDFRLEGVDGTDGAAATYGLADLRGRPVVLVFYPADDSPVCTQQLTTYSRQIGQFADLDAQVLAISPQGLDSHRRFAAGQGGFAFPLLADTDKRVGGCYGILGPMGFYKRSVFVVDVDGVVRYAHRATAGFGFRPVEEIVAAIDAAG